MAAHSSAVASAPGWWSKAILSVLNSRGPNVWVPHGSPVASRSSVTWARKTVLPEVLGIRPEQAYDNRLGRALDRLYPHLGELWACLVSSAIQTYELELNVLHWDITSIYFEGEYANSELAAYGYSRDHRSDTKQVNLEVDVSHDGYVPVLYHTLAGNTADIIRPLPHLQALQHFLTRPADWPTDLR